MNLEKSDTLVSSTVPSPIQPLFYVVSKRKFFMLSIATFSFYNLYWFWKQWHTWQAATQKKAWPLLRAYFSIFFAYSLFNEMETAANKITGLAHKRAHIFAVIYIIVEVAFLIISDIPVIGAIYLPAVIGLVSVESLILWQGQVQANIASLDDKGQGNRDLTPLNYLWIAIGILFWILTIVTAMMSLYTEY